jgi:hypothetical protein
MLEVCERQFQLNPGEPPMTLVLEQWQDVPLECDRELPGVGHHNPRVMDLSQRATTADQQRIELALDTLVPAGARILHVGVGNSSLAHLLNEREVEILGLTVNEAEKDHANSQGLARYSTIMANKYSDDMDAIYGPFDFIIDNNPASFGCCVKHFEQMLAHYVRLLAPGGSLITDRKGMYWCYENGPMRLRFEDLETIARSYPFVAKRLNDDIYALQRTG